MPQEGWPTWAGLAAARRSVDMTRSLTASNRVRWGVFVLLSAGYAVLLLFQDSLLGRATPILATFPVVAVAWFFGYRFGLLAALAAIPINVSAEYFWFGLPLQNVLGSPAFWVGHAALISVSLAIGALRRTLDRIVVQREALMESNRMLDEEIRGHMRTEENLKEAISKMEALVNASPTSIAALDRNGFVTMWNPAAERVFGWSAADVLGKENPIVPVEFEESANKLWDRLLGGESVHGIEVRRQRRDGSLIDVSISTAAWYDASGNVDGIVGVIVDLSERRKAEKTVLQERKRMAREMHDGLAQMLAYVSAETAGISVLMESGDSEGVRREIDQLNRNARELSGEIRQSILGLRIASSDPDEFATMYTDYLRDFAGRNQLDLRLVGFAVLDRVG